ncbi:hypothetical protein KKG41_03155 [Patescibacteria group bacterium]|nr:hypothetical protein [Patescibacteria group bacterium]
MISNDILLTHMAGPVLREIVFWDLRDALSYCHKGSSSDEVCLVVAGQLVDTASTRSNRGKTVRQLIQDAWDKNTICRVTGSVVVSSVPLSEQDVLLMVNNGVTAILVPDTMLISRRIIFSCRQGLCSLYSAPLVLFQQADLTMHLSHMWHYGELNPLPHAFQGISKPYDLTMCVRNRQ